MPRPYLPLVIAISTVRSFTRGEADARVADLVLKAQNQRLALILM
jgi:hypothetical protein